LAKPIRDLTEKTLATRQLYSGRILDVREDEVRLPDGKTGTREYVRHPGAVVVIPLLDSGEVVLEHQWRHPLGRVFIELPAGKIDRGEDTLDCAKRELLEETGYVAREWTLLATMHPCVGYSDERLVYYLARGLSHEGARPDDGEHLEVFTMPLVETLEWIREGRITDAKTVAGLFWAEKLVKGEWPGA
jgi:ADP-ribose diphosphatase